MVRLTLGVVTALATWVTAVAARGVPTARDWISDIEKELATKLSSGAEIYLPETVGFDAASTRWSNLEAPQVNVVVVPSTAKDISETVKFANKRDVPFLAYNTAHGALTTLGKMDYGIEIYMKKFSSVDIAGDGKTATIGGGTGSKVVTDTLWEAGKQAVTGTCECVSFLGPALGGGHGWLQGHHGLIADQFVTIQMVLADATIKTIKSDSDLWWAMKGAGHNFGIVTAVTIKIFDIQHTNWAIETLTFKGDKVEAVYEAINENLLPSNKQPEGVINWSYWLNNPGADASKPVILLYLIQEGVKSLDSAITKPFHDIGPISIEPLAGTYKDLAAWTGIATTSPPCQKAGSSNPRFPVYLEKYNIPAQRQAYDIFASEANGSSPFSNSIYMFEGYSMQGVKAVDADSTAFAFRGDNILSAPLLSYAPTNEALDTKASELGVKLRNIIHKGTNREQLHTYVNYAYGDEKPEGWYGGEKWRQDRLQALKKKYDPNGKFSFYAPIA